MARSKVDATHMKKSPNKAPGTAGIEEEKKPEETKTEQPQEEAVEATGQHQELQGQDISAKQEESVQGAKEGKEEDQTETEEQAKEEAVEAKGQHQEPEVEDTTKTTEEPQEPVQAKAEEPEPEPVQKERKTPGRKKKKQGKYKLINISVEVNTLAKLDIAKAKYNDNLTAYINHIIEQDLEAHFEEYRAFYEQYQAIKAMMAK